MKDAGGDSCCLKPSCVCADGSLSFSEWANLTAAQSVMVPSENGALFMYFALNIEFGNFIWRTEFVIVFHCFYLIMIPKTKILQ